MRVDQVGSLLRPARLKDAYARFHQGQISKQGLREAQDEAILESITTQEAHGLPVLTDGEFRRLNFMESFGEVVGMEEWQKQWQEVVEQLNAARDRSNPAVQRGINPVLRVRQPVRSKLRLERSRPLEEFHYAQSIAANPVKVTLINPDRILEGFDRETPHSAYDSVAEFLSDVVAVEREIVRGLAEAGCRYVQIDGPSYTRYVDEKSLDAMRAEGDDPVAALDRAVAADNAVIADVPGVVFGLHLCRGNRQSQWHREGFYDAIAERLLQGLNHQRLLLEYDTERAGGFEPLRFLPKNKIAVLGLITTKTPRVESGDELLRRIEQAARFAPVEQLALSPQCGFSSDVAGNLLSEDDQWRKLDVMLETAAKVWE
jgi:5-methyltetrahydropteroyltriglutamate--homocysteine methyltransferase